MSSGLRSLWTGLFFIQRCGDKKFFSTNHYRASRGCRSRVLSRDCDRRLALPPAYFKKPPGRTDLRSDSGHHTSIARRSFPASSAALRTYSCRSARFYLSEPFLSVRFTRATCETRILPRRAWILSSYADLQLDLRPN